MDLSFPGQQTATATSCIPHDSVYMPGPRAGKSENGFFRCDTWLQIFQNDSKIWEAEVTLNPLINKICKPCQISSEPTAMKKYEMFNTETFQSDWERVYSLPFKITLDTKLREFHYKILHRICYTTVMLFKFGSSETPLCYFCNEELETLEHFLFHCKKVNTFWNELNTILKSWDLQPWSKLLGH